MIRTDVAVISRRSLENLPTISREHASTTNDTGGAQLRHHADARRRYGMRTGLSVTESRRWIGLGLSSKFSHGLAAQEQFKRPI